MPLGSAQIIEDHLPPFKILDLITSAKSSLPCERAHSQALGIGTWTSSGAFCRSEATLCRGMCDPLCRVIGRIVADCELTPGLRSRPCCVHRRGAASTQRAHSCLIHTKVPYGPAEALPGTPIPFHPFCHLTKNYTFFKTQLSLGHFSKLPQWFPHTPSWASHTFSALPLYPILSISWH